VDIIDGRSVPTVNPGSSWASNTTSARSFIKGEGSWFWKFDRGGFPLLKGIVLLGLMEDVDEDSTDKSSKDLFGGGCCYGFG
jgi:hypothetical protein